MIRSLCAVTAVGVFAFSANAASIFLTYADPPGELSVHHETAGPGGSFSTLTVGTQVDLAIDLTDFGMGEVDFLGATFNKTVNIGSVTEVQPGLFIANATDGFFEFLDGDNNFIAGGTYGLGGASGAAFILTASGNLTANASFVGGDLEYTVGSFLQGILDAENLTIDVGSADASWTLTAITPDAFVTNEGFFSTFDSNGSFTGTIETIPAPGAVALLGLGGLAATRRRR